MDKISTSETPIIEMAVTEIEVPKAAKKSLKRATTTKPTRNSTEAARDRVKIKLAAAKRPNKADMIDRLENGY